MSKSPSSNSLNLSKWSEMERVLRQEMLKVMDAHVSFVSSSLIRPEIVQQVLNLQTLVRDVKRSRKAFNGRYIYPEQRKQLETEEMVYASQLAQIQGVIAASEGGILPYNAVVEKKKLLKQSFFLKSARGDAIGRLRTAVLELIPDLEAIFRADESYEDDRSEQGRHMVFDAIFAYVVHVAKRVRLHNVNDLIQNSSNLIAEYMDWDLADREEVKGSRNQRRNRFSPTVRRAWTDGYCVRRDPFLTEGGFDPAYVDPDDEDEHLEDDAESFAELAQFLVTLGESHDDRVIVMAQNGRIDVVAHLEKRADDALIESIDAEWEVFDFESIPARTIVYGDDVRNRQKNEALRHGFASFDELQAYREAKAAARRQRRAALREERKALNERPEIELDALPEDLSANQQVDFLVAECSGAVVVALMRLRDCVQRYELRGARAGALKNWWWKTFDAFKKLERKSTEFAVVLRYLKWVKAELPVGARPKPKKKPEDGSAVQAA